MSEILKLKQSNCKNCYKCIRNCPVKAISFSGDQAQIVENECILCGHCFVVCPQNAKEIIDDTECVKELLRGEDPVIVSLAPSFVANYEGVGIESMEKALKRLGFFAVEETAIGATIVKKKYEEIVREHDRNVIISSSCPSVNMLIQKHHPDCAKYLADVVTPMVAHCVDIKRRYKFAKTVFIGPCVAKKYEARHSNGIVDASLTFENLTQWLESEGIELEKSMQSNEKSRARLFPTSGGILKTMECNNADYDYIAVDGLDSCISVLNDLENGNVKNCFIEMSACAGGCVCGPVMEKHHNSRLRNHLAAINYAGEKDFDVSIPEEMLIRKEYPPISLHKNEPTEEDIREILKQMGKADPQNQLNCGSCGYNSCREKAIAIYYGKADVSMCLPYLQEKAESFSDQIINNTPNGIIVLNDDLEVQQINSAAGRLLNIHNISDILGEQVVRILDPINFISVRSTGRNIRDKKVYLADYNRYVEETIIYDRAYHLLICIMRDVSDMEDVKERKETISRKTAEIADEVVDKQMRIVQEIAFLLGETAAETKVALSKLKESIRDE